MNDALTIITSIAVLLFVGVICSWIASKIRIPEVLLLLTTGILFGMTTYKEKPLISFPDLFLTSMAILALALIVFDSTARWRIKEVNSLSMQAIKISIIATILHLIFFSITIHYILGVTFWLALLFATMTCGTGPEVLLTTDKNKNKLLTLLQIESLFNTPLTVIFPFVVLDLIQNVTGKIISSLIEQLVPFIMKFIVGLGAGVFVGIILFKIMHKAYTDIYTSLAVVIAALLSYVLAENLGGSGVLAVTALGLFFGKTLEKQKTNLLTIEGVLAKGMFILIYILLGLVIKIPLNKEFIIKSLILFLAYLIIRFISIIIATRKSNTLKQKIYLTLNSPKGIATATVIFIFAIYNIEGMRIILDMTLSIVLYSIILSSIILPFSNFFTENKEKTQSK
jgi:NhaP-type Na+/H+ or K+/H+ antiporter